MQDTHRSQDAPEREQDMEEHEQEARRRDADERSPEEREDLLPDSDDKPAPPGGVNQPRG
jgi:hypothetical protein